MSVLISFRINQNQYEVTTTKVVLQYLLLLITGDNNTVKDMLQLLFFFFGLNLFGSFPLVTSFPLPQKTQRLHFTLTSSIHDPDSIQIYESDFPGAGEPRQSLSPHDIPSLLMKALENNDFPLVDSGIKAMWSFSNDNTRHVFHHNITEFIQSAHETATTWPTSFYGSAMYGTQWTVENDLNLVGGTDGWIATQVVKTVASDGRVRRWQWELRKQRRPPSAGCWYVESVGSSDRLGRFEADS